jgi:hypothetical protein
MAVRSADAFFTQQLPTSFFGIRWDSMGSPGSASLLWSACWPARLSPRHGCCWFRRWVLRLCWLPDTSAIPRVTAAARAHGYTRRSGESRCWFCPRCCSFVPGWRVVEFGLGVRSAAARGRWMPKALSRLGPRDEADTGARKSCVNLSPHGPHSQQTPQSSIHNRTFGTSRTPAVSGVRLPSRRSPSVLRRRGVARRRAAHR